MAYILPTVAEWPLGTPRYPVKKVSCALCGQELWLEVSPEYLLVSELVRFVGVCCMSKKRGNR